MRSYHRLTEGERNQVYALKKAGLTQCAIADQICVNKSTISRELKRNTGLRGYRPKQAHRLACARYTACKCKAQYVRHRLVVGFVFLKALTLFFSNRSNCWT
jgi:IS30 family transposase